MYKGMKERVTDGSDIPLAETDGPKGKRKQSSILSYAYSVHS